MPFLFSTGLLVVYCHRFDILIQSSRIYFVACTIGMHIGGGRRGGGGVLTSKTPLPCR